MQQQMLLSSPMWDPEGVAEPYLQDLRAQASWGGFDPDRDVLAWLAYAMRMTYGPDYNYADVSRVLADIDREAREARRLMKSDPRLRRSIFDGHGGPLTKPALKPFLNAAHLKEQWGIEQSMRREALRHSPRPLAVPKLAPAVIAVPRLAPVSAPIRTTQSGTLNAARLRRSIVPTWLALVVFSWISLLWGAMLSMPVGVGFGILGFATIGVVVVPLWATLFGLSSMSGAASGTLASMNFKPIGEHDPLMQASKQFSKVLGIPPPQLGTIDVENAFAMGATVKRATVAIGEPLRKSMSEQQVLAILGHELGHVVSGDMRRMMLMRGFQNATVWFMVIHGAKQLARWVLGWFSEFYILSFSRKREYWADAIGAELAGKEAMICALRALQKAPALTAIESKHARFMFRGHFNGLLNTHPSFEQRITALEKEIYIAQLPRSGN